MKPDWSHLDKWRGQEKPFTSPLGATHGAFLIPFNGRLLRIIATDGCAENGEYGQWEHVSVHVYDPVFKKQLLPTWTQMCYVKSLFWEPSETVVQYHPRDSDYVNIHDYVLHMWRPKHLTIPTPPILCV